MRPWTSEMLYGMARYLLSHRQELETLDPDEPVGTMLERINALVPDEARVMMLNARVETDLGLLGERLVEGVVPPEGDDGFHPEYRMVYGRLGNRIFLLPHLPQVPPEAMSYRTRLETIFDALKDGSHPNLQRRVPVPTFGTRTYAAVTFYMEDTGGREFARFAWRKDLPELDAAWLIKDAWRRLAARQDALRPRKPQIPS